MVVVSDLVENVNDIHPPRKQKVGRRLANWALAETYGKPQGKYRHASFASMKIKGQKAVIEFNDAKAGIHSDDKPVETLEICDASGVFPPARAIIDDKDGSLIVWNDAVRKPVAVRYMFSNGGIGNLKDTSGLPVAPFRTDSPFIVADRAAAELAQEMALTDIEISGYDYKRGKLKKGDKLFLNRNYPINIVPERFREFDMLIREATPGRIDPALLGHSENRRHALRHCSQERTDARRSLWLAGSKGFGNNVFHRQRGCFAQNILQKSQSRKKGGTSPNQGFLRNHTDSPDN